MDYVFDNRLEWVNYDTLNVFIISTSCFTILEIKCAGHTYNKIYK